MNLYEEKYNEILAWARKNKARLNGVPIEEVLPELAESEDEDERIRKWIVKFITEQYPECWKDKKNKMLAYLEKQKEQKPADNPKWAELTWKDINEIERIINNVHYEFQNGIGEDSFGELVLERFREYKDDDSMDEQKPAEWSEEDEKVVKSIINYLSYDGTQAILTKEIDKWVAWLKSLRPQ